MGSNRPSRQTNDFKIDSCHFLAYHSALLGWDKDWLAQCQDNVTEWDITLSGHGGAGVPVRQHYEVAMSVHYHKLVPVLV